ncbi:unnamed protein product [Vitrella brassicaformis CCMP3155]|uniref:Transmembrane protein n=1 Tax=Vitrella brassicaformis (strain CCMP3155) TaxID=1169540 RepID=A0A0G4EUZ1_VITBC|nr:unnamed protein product [Vitrella brassicaformis CCMP3155]|eukprot:CEM02152.1 unnamed protein product [Vitrella brassicaformis CCMP3155]
MAFGNLSMFFFVLTVACIAISITFSNVSADAMRYYTSCHGSTKVHHDIFYVLLAVQLILVCFHWRDRRPSSHPRLTSIVTQQSQLRGHPQARAVALSGPRQSPSRDEDDVGDADPSPRTRRASCLLGIHWNSVWMSLYMALYFLGFHASLYGWRVYGNSDSLETTWMTCQSQDDAVRRSRISEFSYIEGFWAFATAFVAIRKCRDPWRVSNYVGLRVLRECCSCQYSSIAYCQVLLQLSIIIAAGTKIGMCWTGGYGTPMQLLFGFLLACVTLWVVVILTHVLQVDYALPGVGPSLEYHWLWATISLAIIWGCGFLFYLSVYGIPTPDMYWIWHFSFWVIFFLLLMLRFNQIFPIVNHGGGPDALAKCDTSSGGGLEDFGMAQNAGVAAHHWRHEDSFPISLPIELSTDVGEGRAVLPAVHETKSKATEAMTLASRGQSSDVRRESQHLIALRAQSNPLDEAEETSVAKGAPATLMGKPSESFL